MNSPGPRAITPEALVQQLSGLSGCSAVSLCAVRTNDDAQAGLLLCELGPQSRLEPIDLRCFIKWLRVNDRAITLPDRYHVIDDLPISEQEWLKRGDVTACVPVIADGELLCLALLHGRSAAAAKGDEFISSLQGWAREAAIAWRQTLNSRRFEQESAAAYRSQQLTTAGHLAASVAHEVRNPLAGVRSIVQLVKDTHPAPERHAQLLGQVLDEVDRINHTVSGFLGLARPHESNVTVCDLGPMSADAVRFVETSARRAQVQLDLRVEKDSAIRVDPREFRQMLLNILLNACEACRPGDAVNVVVDRTLRDHENFAEVRVQDTGPGMSLEVQSRVFDPFFTTKVSGSGLGLSVTRDLSRKYGGDLRVASDPGVGTQAVLEFQVVERP